MQWIRKGARHEMETLTGLYFLWGNFVPICFRLLWYTQARGNNGGGSLWYVCWLLLTLGYYFLNIFHEKYEPQVGVSLYDGAWRWNFTPRGGCHFTLSNITLSHFTLSNITLSHFTLSNITLWDGKKKKPLGSSLLVLKYEFVLAREVTETAFNIQ